MTKTKWIRTQDGVTRRSRPLQTTATPPTDRRRRVKFIFSSICFNILRKNRLHGARVTPTRAHYEQINRAPTRPRPSLWRRISLVVCRRRPIAEAGGRILPGQDWQVTSVTPHCRQTHCSARPPMPAVWRQLANSPLFRATKNRSGVRRYPISRSAYSQRTRCL